MSGRWAAGVEYLGTRYSGWQAQPHAPSVQGEVEKALSQVADHPVQTVAAGRTDAGVHGFHQVVHFDSQARRTPYAWLLGTNTNLAEDVALRWVQPVRDDFHARFSARSRRYRYVIHNARYRSALLDGRCAWVPWDLDADAMHRAAQSLLGEQDFSAFRGSECQSRSPMRNVIEVAVGRRARFVWLDIRANAFLHHMVRNIAGSLIEVGTGRQAESWIADVLASRQRTRAGMNAPAGGLYFVEAEYPAEFAVPLAPEFWLP
ncbi:MAG: truA [Panacagrimonas sp.]|nr:tRNA pseudouridine(38-40) synthase TruA [Panacagrimonas sp.]MCC2656185.1 truA [Panacagrimonas sp.]